MANSKVGSFNLPKSIKTSLQDLLSLDDTVLGYLVASIESEKATVEPEEFATRIAEALKDKSTKDIYGIARAVIGIGTIYRENSELGFSRFVASIANSVNEGESKLSDEEQSKLGQRLSSLLKLESLSITAKAFDVLSEHDRAFIKARVITDIRPIFNDVSSGQPRQPVGAVIVHTLKITHAQNNERKEFFVALDSSDIDKLRCSIDEAMTKADSLNLLLNSMPIQYLEVKNDTQSD